MAGLLRTALEQVDIINYQPSNMVRTESGIVQSKSLGVQQFKFNLNFVIENEDVRQALRAFIISQGGSLGTFNLLMREFGLKSAGSATNQTVEVRTNAAVGDTSVNINAGTRATGFFKAGDVIKFSNHNKVYMIKSDVNTDFRSHGTIELTAPLRRSVRGLAAITVQYNNVPFSVFIPEQETISTISSPMLTSFSLRVEERLERST